MAAIYEEVRDFILLHYLLTACSAIASRPLEPSTTTSALAPILSSWILRVSRIPIR